MKKTFNISHPKIKTARLFESVKHDIKKYLKRETNKVLPEGADYWDFDCKFGASEAEAKTIHVKEINKCIDNAETEGLTSFYIEVLAKQGFRA
jgi:hypothetical protein